MFVKQLFVLIENREGRLEQVTEVLKEQDINILSLSMVDTTEYGILGMIVPDPDKAKAMLREKGFSVMLTDALAVRLEDQVGELHKMVHILCSQGPNIEYMYALASVNCRTMIVRASDRKTVTRVVTDDGLVLYSNEEMYWQLAGSVPVVWYDRAIIMTGL